MSMRQLKITKSITNRESQSLEKYLQEIGKTSIDDISVDDLKTMVKYHVLGDTISTPSFTDGKLPVPTMHGEYLITSVNNENGVSRYIVNRRAIILQPNIHTGTSVPVPGTARTA